ncbi:hypothetical protein [Chryseobacterium wanjuense]
MKQQDVPILQYPWPYEVGLFPNLFMKKKEFGSMKIINSCQNLQEPNIKSMV